MTVSCLTGLHGRRQPRRLLGSRPHDPCVCVCTSIGRGATGPRELHRARFWRPVTPSPVARRALHPLHPQLRVPGEGAIRRRLAAARGGDCGCRGTSLPTAWRDRSCCGELLPRVRTRVRFSEREEELLLRGGCCCRAVETHGRLGQEDSGRHPFPIQQDQLFHSLH